MIKKIIAIICAAALSLTLAGCYGNTTTESIEELSAPESYVELVCDASGFNDDLAGLCDYLEDAGAVAGERTETSFKEIGAVGGYRYRFEYNKSTVQVEVYEFDLESLDEKGSECLSFVSEKGFFTVLGNDVSAVINPNGKYILVYIDESDKEINLAHRDGVEKLFLDFYAE